MPDPEIDIQTVIGSLTTKIAQLTAEMAVKDALIEALRAQGADIMAEPALTVVDDEADEA